MKTKRGLKFLEIINSKPAIGCLIFIILGLSMVLAGDVIVKEGALDVGDDLNVTGNIFGSVIYAARPSYNTGWINRNDWTNIHMGSNTTKNADSNVEHNLDAPLPELLVKVLFSVSGTDADSFEIHNMNIDYTTGANYHYGISVFNADNDSFQVQTGINGILYMNSVGNRVVIDAEDWYYKIKVFKLG